MKNKTNLIIGVVLGPLSLILLFTNNIIIGGVCLLASISFLLTYTLREDEKQHQELQEFLNDLDEQLEKQSKKVKNL